MHDVIIIGTGPAGLSAAIFCGRANLKTLVLGKPQKSQAHLAMKIENYLGFPEGIDGPVLLNKGILQAQKFGVEFLKEEIVSAEKKGLFEVKTDEGKGFSCKTLIIASGVPIKLSGILNEEKLTSKGVHYCVSCDGAFYKDKNLAIIGNGNHAAEDALEAVSYTKNITIIANADQFVFSNSYHNEITKYKIKTVLGKVKEFKGEKWFESVIMEGGSEHKFDGVFMACGTAGALDFAANLGLEIKDNVLVVDENNMTNVPGIFGAGNCTGRCRQIAKNAGDGCNAAISAIKYLRSSNIYMDYVHNKIDVVTPEATLENVEMPTKGMVERQENKQQAKTQQLLPKARKKLRVGWFSFSCCEDSTIVFTELLNDYWDKWKQVMDIRCARVLKKECDMTNLDVSFVEGAIADDRQKEKLIKIREASKKIVAIGSCAVTGMPSSQRNDFNDATQREIAPIIEEFQYNKNVVPLDKVVQVDERVPGCPMTEAGFLKALDKLLKEFGINA